MHGEGNPDARFVRTRLALPSVLPEGVAVVRKHEYHGLVQPVAERGHERAERLVDGEQGFAHTPLILEPGGALRGARRRQRAHPRRGAAQRPLHGGWLLDRQAGEGAVMPGGGDPRSVRGTRREQEEERLRRGRAPYESDRAVREPIGRVATDEDGRPLVDGVEVPIHRRSGLVPLRQEPVPARRHEREPPERVPVQVLPHEARAVALVVEPRGERGRRVEPRTVPVVEDAGVPSEQARQQARPRRAAQRCVGERVRELRPPRAGAGELRREPRHRREGARSLVVGEDDDHVGSVVGAFVRLRSDERRAEPDERDERRPGHPTAGRREPHSFRTFQMCSAGNARAHSRGA